MWMGSGPHRANILNGGFNRIGVGVRHRRCRSGLDGRAVRHQVAAPTWYCRGWVPALPPMATGPVLPAGPVATSFPGRRLRSADPRLVGSVAPSHPGPEDALVDVIPHATTGGRAPRMRAGHAPRARRSPSWCSRSSCGDGGCTPAASLTPAVAGAAGVVLVALLLLAAARVGCATRSRARSPAAGAAAWHDAPVELVVGRAVAVAAAAASRPRSCCVGTRADRSVSRGCASSCTLVAAAAVGGVLGAALLDARGRDRPRTERRRPVAHRVADRASRSARAWCWSRPRCSRSSTRAPASYLRGRDIEAAPVRPRGRRRRRSRSPRSRIRSCSPARWCSCGPRSGSDPPRWRGPGSCSSPPPTGRRPGSSVPSSTSPRRRDAVGAAADLRRVDLFATLGPRASPSQERDTAEAARAAAAERFRRTFHDSPVAMAVTTLDGRIVETNRALCQLLGHADHALVGTELRGAAARRQRRARAPSARRARGAARRRPDW